MPNYLISAPHLYTFKASKTTRNALFFNNLAQNKISDPATCPLPFAAFPWHNVKEMRNYLLAAALLMIPGFATAEEGMWLFNQAPKQSIKSKYGFDLKDSLLDKMRLSSVRFDNGGSGSFVSSQGLLFTNHHVGSECISQLGTKENNYIVNGFLARTHAEEKKCPDLEVNVLLSMEDVTAKVKAGITDAMPLEVANKTRKAHMTDIEKECNTRTGNRCDVVTLYAGGQYHLYQYKKYNDIRLVFAPEEAIAAFGGDPDNFTYPRYCLDFALFRAYENDKPAKPAEYLKWAKQGAKEGELVFVTGHPGKTNRLDTVAALEFGRDVEFKLRLPMFESMISRLIAFSEVNAEQKRIARDLLLTYQNSYKAISGFNGGLQDPALINAKRVDENKLRASIADNPEKNKQFGSAWDDVAKAHEAYKSFYVRIRLLGALANSELFGRARTLVRLAVEKPKPNAERLREFSDTALPQLESNLYSEAPIYPALEKQLFEESFLQMQKGLGDDPLLAKILAGRTPKQAAEFYVDNSQLVDPKVRKKYGENLATVAASDDAIFQLAKLMDPETRRLRKEFEDKVEAVLNASYSKIAQARFAAYGASEYPDATFTLRLSYAKVMGYTTEKGEPRPWTTRTSGLWPRVTGKEPFEIPESWKKAQKALTPTTPFNFVSTADTHGGNSGSPTINTKGELTGILFDGNIEGLPNNYVYRDVRERSIHVASQIILESLKKVYKADAILKEIGR